MHLSLMAALLFALRIDPPGGVPLQQPQIAASGQTVALTFGAAKAIYFVLSSDGGKAFSEPLKVAEPTATPLGRHRGPRIAMMGQTVVISAITNGDVVAWRSTDAGKTWSAAIPVSGPAGAAREGLHAMAAGPDGLLYMAWLDLREKRMQLYGSLSKDSGATWSENRLIYDSPAGNICECCHPSIALGPRGALHVMWRNWLGGSRDMYLAVSHDEGRSFETTKLGERTWKLNACPMDGGGLAVAPGGEAYTVWRREDKIYAARPSQAESLLGQGKDAAIAVGKRGPYYAWRAPDGLMLRAPGNREPKPLSTDGAYVQLARFDGRVIAAWEERGAIQVRVLD